MILYVLYCNYCDCCTRHSFSFSFPFSWISLFRSFLIFLYISMSFFCVFLRRIRLLIVRFYFFFSSQNCYVICFGRGRFRSLQMKHNVIYHEALVRKICLELKQRGQKKNKKSKRRNRKIDLRALRFTVTTENNTTAGRCGTNTTHSHT